MITLITVFYVMLFSINEPVQPDCEDKLKELNYAYDIPLLYEDSLASKAIHIQEIKSILKCFEYAVKQDTSKVLLVTLHHLYKERRYSNIGAWFGIKEVLKIYGLPPKESFFTSDFVQSVRHKKKPLEYNQFRIELVSNSNKRLSYTINGNRRYHYSSTLPF